MNLARLISLLTGLHLVIGSFANPDKTNFEWLTIPADISYGVIGHSHISMDDPADNAFTVTIPRTLNPNDEVFLIYELQGVDHHTGVARSINGRPAVGGYLVNKNSEWTRQVEKVNPSILHQGDNTFNFTLLPDAEYQYEIRNLRLRIGKSPADQNENRLELTNSESIFYHNRVYLKGFASAGARISINGNKVEALDGEFEHLIYDKNFTTILETEVVAVFPNGEVLRAKMEFCEDAGEIALQFPLEPIAQAQAKTFNFQKKERLAIDGFFFEAVQDAFCEELDIELAHLRTIDLPAIDLELINVTAGAPANRIRPSNISFEENVQIGLAFDPKKIPAGYTSDDIRTFLFDYSSKEWKELPKLGIDLSNNLILSSSDQTGDVINGIISVPESAQSTAFNPTQMQGIQAGLPSAGINTIAPPSSNNRGSASLSYPINIPAGRKGIQPALFLTYDSEGGNSWCGLGWDLTIPSIGIDTRWGVPRYNNNLETETYTLNGQQLTPVAHRGDEYLPREAEKRFYPRVEGAFNKIVRHGDHPNNYWWEVTDKQGTRYFYGGLPGVGVVENAVLRDGVGNVAHWTLHEMRDLHDNFVRYNCVIVEDYGTAEIRQIISPNIEALMGYQIYVNSITYTGHQQEEGKYTITFTRDGQGEGQIARTNANRPDVTIDARLGFKRVTADLLERIEVKFGSQLIRSYEFKYRTGAFSKTLLDSLIEFDSENLEFTRHSFDYFNELENEVGDYQPLEPNSREWALSSDPIDGELINPVDNFFDANVTALSGIRSTNFGFGLAATVGPPGSPADKSASAGVNYSYNKSTTSGILSFLDIDGDGLPDKVYVNDDGDVLYKKNLSGADGEERYAEVPSPIVGLDEIYKEKSSSHSVGGESHFGVFVGAGFSRTTSNTSTFFADVNGDRLVDLVKNGRVLFNHIDPNTNFPVFTTSSVMTPSPINESGALDPTILNQDTLQQEIAEAKENNPLQDVVRYWKAPFSGLIEITGDVSLVEFTTPERLAYETADGVTVSIQKENDVLWTTSISETDYAPQSPENVEGFNISAGEEIFFRVQSNEDGNYDQIVWNPVVTYLNEDPNIIDANYNEIYRFDAERDFLTTGMAETVMPIDGTVQVEGLFSKARLTDTIHLEVFYNDDTTPIWSRSYPGGWEITDENIVIDAISTVSGDDEYRFKITANTNVDWNAISWKPVITYTSSSDANNSISNSYDGSPIFQLFPIVDYSVFSKMIQKTEPWSSPSDVGPPAFVRARILPATLPDFVNGEITFTIKSAGRLVSEQTVEIIQGVFQDNWELRSIPPGIDYYFEFHTPDNFLYEHINVADVRVAVGGPFNEETAGYYTVLAEDEQLFGPLHRYWGQFIYNGNEPYKSQPIEQSVLTIDESDPDRESRPEMNPSTARFQVAYPSTYLNRWNGSDDLTWIQLDTVSSARLGEDELSFFDPFAAGLDRRAINKKTVSNTLYAATVPFNAGGGWSKVVADFMDLNGDGYPDNVGDDKVQYTTGQGALSAIDNPPSFGEVQRSTSFNQSLSLGGVVAAYKTASSNGGNLSAKKQQGAEADGRSVTGVPSGAVSNSFDDTDQSLMDINADGLPDLILSDGKVRLNLGYKFAEHPENWGFSFIRNGNTQGASAGLGINIVNHSIAAGIGLAGNQNETSRSLQDMNGDGLPDMVSMTGNNLSVRINTGNGYEPSTRTWSNIGKINTGASTSESVNGAFTVCIVTPFAKICTNPSANAGQNINKQTANIQDVDGDGYPDILQSEGTGQLAVQTSKIGRTNKLRSVNRPLGANFTIDYKRVGNTYDLPNTVWTMSEVALFDGFVGDGVDTMRTRFAYEGGIYDRHEREFYGFSTVISQELDTDDDNEVYRTYTRRFLNKDYYQKGLPQSEEVKNGADEIFTVVSYEYQLQDVVTGQALPPDFTNQDAAAAFPAMVEMTTDYYERLTAPQKVSKMTYEYDQYGNMSHYRDFGDLDENEVDLTSDDNYEATITYHEYPATYIVSSPSSVIVSADGNTFRHRETVVDGTNGELREVTKFLEDGSQATVNIDYNEYGNIETLTRPENTNGERLSFSYEYDPEVQTYVEEITDDYGYSSAATYDYRYGEMLLSRDINGQEIRTTLDSKGRVEEIIGPHELADNTADYTIRFQYFPDATVPWALTQHFDEDHPDDPIETISFIDGLGRPIQVKKDASIYNAADQPDTPFRTISGRVEYDAFGRMSSQYYPVLEDITAERGLFNGEVDVIQPTTTYYDAIDRVVTTVLPDSSISRKEYTFGQDRENRLMLLTKVTDAEGNIKDYFTNVRGLSTSILEYINDADHGDVWTSFVYNPINENIAVIDDQDNAITYQYDWFGRNVSYTHPDGGTTQYTYDLADNMTSKLTANLTGAGMSGEDLPILYNYELERLVGIVYPVNPKNNVIYQYGVAGDIDNRAGRIAVQIDATGKLCYSYGRQGELTKTVRYINVIEGRPPRVYTTRWRYDSWNRLQQMIYPDGEILDYNYNLGGKLNSLGGEKLGVPYPYVQQLGYDKFEQRVYLKYGNQTETTYSYEEDRRRLHNMIAETASNRPMMNNTYSYDRVSNVLGYTNTAPVPQIWQIGGPAEMSYTYDDLYRLKTAQGTWNTQLQTHRYATELTYNSLHDITNKTQIHQRRFSYQNNWQTSNFTTYNNDYDYESSQPHAATHIGNRTYDYDANGNLVSRVDDNFFGQQRHLIWDEENRLLTIDDDERMHNYTYDASNTRVIKQKDAGQIIWINGVPVGGNDAGNYTIYVNPYTVVRGGGFTKHFYIDGQRICSKQGLGPYGLHSTWEDFNYWSNSWGNWNDFYAWGNFDNFANNGAYDNWDNINSGNWDPTLGGNDDYPNDWYNNNEFFSYYYHPDHLGNSSYITDQYGEVHQHFEYFPFGEFFVQEHKNSDRSPYRFNGKFFDEETGLYDYGARYYAPQESRWLSVDPMAHKYPGWSPYNYTLQNPVKYVDPDGNVPLETIADVASIGVSAYDMWNEPSWGNAGFLAWDVAAAVLPYVPGSYVAKGAKVAASAAKGTKAVKGVKTAETAASAAKVAKGGEKAGGAAKAVDKANDATKRRVYLRKETRRRIQENAPKTPDGDFIDPNTGKIIPKDGPFDYGHKPGQEWHRRKKMHQERGSTRKEVREAENNPDLYQIEDPASNRSRKFENKDN